MLKRRTLEKAAMRHVAVYVRVSKRNGQDFRSQLPDLERWAAAQDQPVRWYKDNFTGKTMDRPGWGRLQAAIDAAEVSAVVVWRLDRLGRTAKGLTALFHDLREKKINLISLKDGLDLGTAAGRLMANVLASVRAVRDRGEGRADFGRPGRRPRQGQGLGRRQARPSGAAVRRKGSRHLATEAARASRLPRSPASSASAGRPSTRPSARDFGQDAGSVEGPAEGSRRVRDGGEDNRVLEAQAGLGLRAEARPLPQRTADVPSDPGRKMAAFALSRRSAQRRFRPPILGRHWRGRHARRPAPRTPMTRKNFVTVHDDSFTIPSGRRSTRPLASPSPAGVDRRRRRAGHGRHMPSNAVGALPLRARLGQVPKA